MIVTREIEREGGFKGPNFLLNSFHGGKKKAKT